MPATGSNLRPGAAERPEWNSTSKHFKKWLSWSIFRGIYLLKEKEQDHVILSLLTFDLGAGTTAGPAEGGRFQAPSKGRDFTLSWLFAAYALRTLLVSVLKEKPEIRVVP